MFRNILPKEFAFFDYFEQHNGLCIKATEELLLLCNDFSRLDDSVKYIKDLESQMDSITHKCTEALIKTFITPFERVDIHKLIKRLDDIADGINGAIAYTKMYKVNYMRDDVKVLIQLIHKANLILKDALKGLRNMKQVDSIKNFCNDIRKIEKEGDEVFKNALSRLFEEGDALEIIKWKEILERFERSLDRCETTANIIESIAISAA